MRNSFIVFAALSSALSLPGCAHVPGTASRSPAEKARVQLHYRVAINPKSDPGSFTVDAFAKFPENPDLSFVDIVELFRGTEIAGEVNTILTTHKDPPLDKILYEMKATEGKNQVSYLINGYPKGFRALGSKSRILCPETFTRDSGKGYWRQTCAADFTLKSTGDYLRAYHHTFECSERGKLVECAYHVEAVMKPIRVPFLARILFNAQNYSATQAAYKSAENMVHTFYSLAKVADFPKPFRGNAVRVVDAYRRSPEYSDVLRIDRAYPPAYEAAAAAVLMSVSTQRE